MIYHHEMCQYNPKNLQVKSLLIINLTNDIEQIVFCANNLS